MDLFLPQRLIPLLAVTGAAASSVVYGAFRQHKQFYPSMVALSASNINMLVTGPPLPACKKSYPAPSKVRVLLPGHAVLRGDPAGAHCAVWRGPEH